MTTCSPWRRCCRPPAWSVCRWVSTTRRTSRGARPRRSSAGPISSAGSTLQAHAEAEVRVPRREVAGLGRARRLPRVDDDQALGVLDRPGEDRQRRRPAPVGQRAHQRARARAPRPASWRSWTATVPVWIAWMRSMGRCSLAGRLHAVTSRRLRIAARLPARLHRHVAHLGARAADARAPARRARADAGRPRGRTAAARRAVSARRPRRRGRARDGRRRLRDGAPRRQLARRLRRAAARGPRPRALGRRARAGRRVGGRRRVLPRRRSPFFRRCRAARGGRAARRRDRALTRDGRRRATQFIVDATSSTSRPS